MLAAVLSSLQLATNHTDSRRLELEAPTYEALMLRWARQGSVVQRCLSAQASAPSKLQLGPFWTLGVEGAQWGGDVPIPP